MTTFPNTIQATLDNIQHIAIPESIFLYGSRARKDHVKESDYEVGAIFKKSKRWKREDLAKLHHNKSLNIYPFNLEDVRSHQPEAISRPNFVTKNARF